MEFPRVKVYLRRPFQRGIRAKAKGRRGKINKFHAVGIATASRKKVRQ